MKRSLRIPSINVKFSAKGRSCPFGVTPHLRGRVIMKARDIGALSCLFLMAGAAVAEGQSQHRGTQPGDTVNVVVHKVRAEKRAQYDSLMRTVWWPAMKEASKK